MNPSRTIVDTPRVVADVVVVSTRIKLASAWRSPVFVLYSIRVYLQARRSPGVVRASLRAQPLRITFWTLSAWTDEAALHAFIRTDPHRSIMRRIRPWTMDPQVRQWSVPADQLSRARLWAEARERIEFAAGWTR
jgi:uncharacterized protein DUF3291